MVGGCACGQVRYAVDRAPIYVNGCHCRDCQKESGSAFAINAMFEREAVAVVQGAPAPDARGMIRCPACASPLWATHPIFGENILFLRTGTLDAAEQLEPDGHFFVRSKHPWITLPADVPTFETVPEAGDALFNAEAEARLRAVTEQA